MNTKHTRVVVTFSMALALLATMGLSASADVATCDAPVLYTAIELLSLLDEPCFAALRDEVEMEIDKGFDSSSSTRDLMANIKARSKAVIWTADDLVERAEADQGGSLTLFASARPASLSRGVGESSKQVLLSKHVQSEYDYASPLDLSDLIGIGYDYDSALDLSQSFKQEPLSKHVLSGYNYDSEPDLSDLWN